MATTKKTRAVLAVERPDAAAFVQLLEDGLAEPQAVDEAYQHAYGVWLESLTDDARRDLAIGSVVQGRNGIGSPEASTPETRLIAIHRHHSFKGDS